MEGACLQTPQVARTTTSHADLPIFSQNRLACHRHKKLSVVGGAEGWGGLKVGVG